MTLGSPVKPEWRRRAAHLAERMDDPQCDPEVLRRTYAQFALLNAVLSNWAPVYRAVIRPALSPRHERSLLDVGCGGGDLARLLARWAARDGVRLRVLGIDPDERAIAFARSRANPDRTDFRAAHSRDLVARGESFDFVTSNHVLHHLEDGELPALLRDCERLTRIAALHSDLRRSQVAHALFGSFAPLLFRGSYIVEDGLTSIRRSFTPEELSEIAPPGWAVVPLAPFRQVLLYAR